MRTCIEGTEEKQPIALDYYLQQTGKPSEKQLKTVRRWASRSIGVVIPASILKVIADFDSDTKKSMQNISDSQIWLNENQADAIQRGIYMFFLNISTITFCKNITHSSVRNIIRKGICAIQEHETKTAAIADKKTKKRPKKAPHSVKPGLKALPKHKEQSTSKTAARFPNEQITWHPLNPVNSFVQSSGSN